MEGRKARISKVRKVIWCIAELYDAELLPHLSAVTTLQNDSSIPVR